MKQLRFLLKIFVVLVVLLAVATLAAIAPTFQTWAARLFLASGPGVDGSLGSLSAGFGEVDVQDLHLVTRGAVLTLPSLQARLPVTEAVLRRKIRAKTLVAKGWTLDLSHPAEKSVKPSVPGRSPAEPINPTGLPADTAKKEVVRVFRGLLTRLRLPIDGELDGVDLEGDVILPGSGNKELVRWHVVLSGGGLAAGREGALEFKADGRSEDDSFLNSVFTHGDLKVSMDSGRTISRVGIEADVSVKDALGTQEGTVSAQASADRAAGGEAYKVDLRRSGRPLATFLGRLSADAGHLQGSWKIDLGEADLAEFNSDQARPSISIAGEGRFEEDRTGQRLHATGTLTGQVARLELVHPSLAKVGDLHFDARFDLARTGHLLRFDRLDVAIGGAKPIAVLGVLQPFELDEKTQKLNLAGAGGDVVALAVRGLPLAWLPALPSPFALVGGDATGRLVVTAGDGGFSLRSETPLAATAISLRQGDRMLLEHLDLSLALSGEAGAQGWKLRWSPLAVDGAGRRLATIEATASRAAGADEPVKVSGTWKADLQAVAQAGSGSALGWLKARSASGEFSGTVGSSPEGDGTITVIGSVPDHTVSASIHADLNGDELEFRVPAKISLGADVSDLTLEGTLVGEKQGARVDVKLSGEHVVLRHLRLLALPLAALGGADVAGAAGTPDRVPFWGGWAGRLAVSLDRLRTEDTEVTHVGGLLDLERGSIRLLGGRWGRGIQNVGRVEGSITFDGSAEAPYTLKAAATLNDVDAASLYPPSQLTEDHQFEGHFTISETLAGSGKTAADLADRTEETFHLSSKAGIVRILKTSVAEAIPEASTPVADTLGTVGSFVGSILGKKESMDAGKNTVSKNAQAVIDFTNQVPEIGFDEASITAVRAADGTFRIAALEMIAPEEHLTGTGRIGYAPGLSLARRPLTLDLQVGVKGQSAELLRKAGLLSSQKDALGYQIADQAISFVGSLGNVDASQWHEWLVKAATRKPEPAPKKGGG